MNCKVQGPGYDYQYCQKLSLQRDENGYGYGVKLCIEYKHASLNKQIFKITGA